MIEKNMKSRHVQKHATESEWLKANIFIPKQAEIIVYDVDETHPYERFKIGDGTTLLANLPFSNENIDLTGYATEDYVTDAINAIPTIDLTDYATQKYVDEAVANVNVNIDLSGYATKKELEEITIQSDWNQTDTTKPDYIKNKPKIGGVFTTSVANNVLMLEQTGAIYTTTIENNILTLI